MTEKPDYAPGSIACIAFDAGAIWKQNQIIQVLEEQVRECEKAGLWANGLDLRSQLQDLHAGLTAAIAFIKEYNK
jgi:hypothetical protein